MWWGDDQAEVGLKEKLLTCRFQWLMFNQDEGCDWSCELVHSRAEKSTESHNERNAELKLSLPLINDIRRILSVLSTNSDRNSGNSDRKCESGAAGRYSATRSAVYSTSCLSLRLRWRLSKDLKADSGGGWINNLGWNVSASRPPRPAGRGMCKWTWVGV